MGRGTTLTLGPHPVPQAARLHVRDPVLRCAAMSTCAVLSGRSPQGTTLSLTAAEHCSSAFGMATRTSCVGMGADVSRVNPNLVRYWTAPAMMDALGGICTRLLSGPWAGASGSRDGAPQCALFYVWLD